MYIGLYCGELDLYIDMAVRVSSFYFNSYPFTYLFSCGDIVMWAFDFNAEGPEFNPWPVH